MENIPGLVAWNHVVHGLYVSSEWSLLISGEGMDRIFLNLGKILAQLPSIQRVYNFGIAAALSEQWQRGQVVPIRTSYRSLSGTMEFKSYSCASVGAKIDCVSCLTRIREEGEGRELSHFGDLVDRELWAIGAVCSFYKIPFESFKLISDYPWDGISCYDIQSRASDYSCSLYQKFQQLPSIKPHGHDGHDIPHPFSDLYWTQSLRQRFLSLSKQWKVKYPDRSLSDLYDRDGETRPKKKTIKLLDRIRDELNPINSRVRREIDSLLTPHRSAKVKVDYDPRLVSTDMKVTINFSSKEDVDHLQSWAENFPFEKIQEKIKGRDV